MDELGVPDQTLLKIDGFEVRLRFMVEMEGVPEVRREGRKVENLCWLTLAQMVRP